MQIWKSRSGSSSEGETHRSEGEISGLLITCRHPPCAKTPFVTCHSQNTPSALATKKNEENRQNGTCGSPKHPPWCLGIGGACARQGGVGGVRKQKFNAPVAALNVQVDAVPCGPEQPGDRRESATQENREETTVSETWCEGPLYSPRFSPDNYGGDNFSRKGPCDP